MVLAILTVYRALLLGALVVGSPWWLLRMATTGRYRAGIWGRLGFVPAKLRRAVERGTRGRGWIWIHAVSVGEVLAAQGVVGGLLEAGFAVALSTTTESGQELARRRFAESPVFYLPLDFEWIVGRYLRVLRPRLVVTMESELWPNLIHACMVREIPLAVVNARISDRSFPRYLRLRWVWRPLLREVSLFLAQSEETAGRLRAMGVVAARVRVSGNLKYDARVGERTEVTRQVASLAEGVRVVVAGSTLAGEEAILLQAWAEVTPGTPDAVLVIAPRHTNRFEEVAEMIQRSGFPMRRCRSLGLEALAPGTVLLLDTIGDLASMYGVGALAFVGGSLVARGGHNPLEPAQFGVPVVMGESYFNFKEIVGAMVAAGGVEIVRAEEIGGTFADLLGNGEKAEALGRRGREVFEAKAGATERTLVGLLELVGGAR